ncbi:MAG: sulfatase-like hydrolase/transferase [bacterium]|nr:sulfatase-like hydrolase/transferase [bacterium]
MEFNQVRTFDRRRRGSRRRFKNNMYDTFAQFLFFSFSAVWMELIYHIFTFKAIDFKFIYPFLFSIGIGAAFAFLTGLFPKRMNKVLSVIIVVALALFYCTELVYKSLFKVPLVMNLAVGGAGDVTQYWKEALREIVKNGPAILLMFLPILPLVWLLKKRQLFTRHMYRVSGVSLIVALVLAILPVALINAMGKNSMIYEHYYELNDQSLAAEQMGIFTTFCRDMEGVGRGSGDLSELLAANASSSSVKNQDQKGTAATATPKPTASQDTVDTSPNIMDIDFDSLIKNESNKEVKILHEFFKNQTPTNKNKYTGMFQGKNLILLTAESYSPWAVNQTLTPTLYKLTHEGFVFNNFYTSLWQTSTSDGEYVALTGLIPDGTNSMKRSKTNSLPFTIAKQFNRFGIESKAYHSNSLSYYDRYLTHPNLGYDFRAAKLGKLSDEYQKDIFTMKNAALWPNSDYDCVQATFKEYSKDSLFHAYYMTLSGHCQYTFEGNNMAAKNEDLVKDLPYTEGGKAYVAQNIELDRALKYLIDELEKQGILNDTVIALSADHYPYELDKKDIDSIAGTTVDSDFDLYKNNFILWNAEIKTPIEISKPCSSLDILPTLSNLFGFTYDSRLLSGKDILSDSEGLVIFNNKNFITDKIKYNNSTKDVTYLVDKSEVSDEYVTEKVKEVKALFAASAGILENDYYKYLESQLSFPDYKTTLTRKDTDKDDK